jgi:hypothetical protein
LILFMSFERWLRDMNFPVSLLNWSTLKKRENQKVKLFSIVSLQYYYWLVTRCEPWAGFFVFRLRRSGTEAEAQKSRRSAAENCQSWTASTWLIALKKDNFKD